MQPGATGTRPTSGTSCPSRTASSASAARGPADGGRFEFVTVKPGRVPWPDGGRQAPHVARRHLRARAAEARRDAHVLPRRGGGERGRPGARSARRGRPRDARRRRRRTAACASTSASGTAADDILRGVTRVRRPLRPRGAARGGLGRGLARGDARGRAGARGGRRVGAGSSRRDAAAAIAAACAAPTRSTGTSCSLRGARSGTPPSRSCGLCVPRVGDDARALRPLRRDEPGRHGHRRDARRTARARPGPRRARPRRRGACARSRATHRSTPMVGRTLLQQAVPTTFGLKAAGWLVALPRRAQRLRDAARDGLAAQLGGAAGTLSALGDTARASPALYAARARPGRADASLAHEPGPDRRARSRAWHRRRRARGRSGSTSCCSRRPRWARCGEGDGGRRRRRCRRSATRSARSPRARLRRLARGHASVLRASLDAGARARRGRVAGRVGGALRARSRTHGRRGRGDRRGARRARGRHGAHAREPRPAGGGLVAERVAVALSRAARPRRGARTSSAARRTRRPATRRGAARAATVGSDRGRARRRARPDDVSRLRRSPRRPRARTLRRRTGGNMSEPGTSSSPAAWRCAAKFSATSTSTARSSARRRSPADFQDLITRYAWGEIWSRPGLDRRTRSCSRWPSSSRRGASTSSRCTSVPRCATASRRTRSRRFSSMRRLLRRPRGEWRVCDRAARARGRSGRRTAREHEPDPGRHRRRRPRRADARASPPPGWCRLGRTREPERATTSRRGSERACSSTASPSSSTRQASESGCERKDSSITGSSCSSGGERHRIDFEELTGKSIVVYGQTEVVKDLIEARLETGGPLLFEAEDVSLHDLDGDRPRVRYVHGGKRTSSSATSSPAATASTASRGPTSPRVCSAPSLGSTRTAGSGSSPTSPPSSEELVYAHHERGFALLSMRSPQLSRLYLQCAPDEDLDEWPDERDLGGAPDAARAGRLGTRTKDRSSRRASRRCAASSSSRCSGDGFSSRATPRTSSRRPARRASTSPSATSRCSPMRSSPGTATAIGAGSRRTPRRACAASGGPSTSPGG